MITGFNTDVKYKGVVYHVQTEDKGTANPLIETLIYKGGEILGSRSGMGALINHAYGLFRTSDYVALVLVTLVLIVGSDALAGLIERRAQRWTS